MSEIYETMAMGRHRTNAADALAWLVDQGAVFGHFIDGASPTHARGKFMNFFFSKAATLPTGMCWRPLTQRPTSGPRVDTAVAAARQGAAKVGQLGGTRACAVPDCLGAVVAKTQPAFAVLETLDNGKPNSAKRAMWMLPLAQRHFFNHARHGPTDGVRAGPTQTCLGGVWADHPVEFPLVACWRWKSRNLLGDGNTFGIETCEILRRLTRCWFADILCAGWHCPGGCRISWTGDGAVGEDDCASGMSTRSPLLDSNARGPAYPRRA